MIVVGGAADILRRMLDYEAAGATKFVLRPIGEGDADVFDHTQRLIEQVIQPIHDRRGSCRRLGLAAVAPSASARRLYRYGTDRGDVMRFRTGPLRLCVVAGAGVLAATTPARALNIVPVYDASVTSLANASVVEGAFQTVANEFDAAFSTPITLKIAVGWGEVDGQGLGAGNVGASLDFLRGGFTYANVVGYLRATATANPADLNLASVVANLPRSDPTGKNSFRFPYAEAQALGLLPARMSLMSGYVGFASNVSWDFDGGVIAAGKYDFMGLAAHELSEAMGRISALSVANPSWATVLDLLRYSAPGVSSFSYANPAYFSIDGGRTNRGSFNNTGSGDRGDWSSILAPGDDQDANVYTGVSYKMSASDWTQLDVLGYGAYVTPPAGSPGVPTSGYLSHAAAVPEPAAWVVILLGFGITGATKRAARSGRPIRFRETLAA